MQRLLPALAATVLAATVSAQLSVVVPDGTANTPGNTSNAFPWGTTATAWPGLRLMCVYGAVNFTNQQIGQPILINRLKWRPNDTSSAVTGGQFNIATVELSTSPTGWAGVTTNYASNHGPDRTLVYDAAVHGAVIHTATPGAAGWTPQSWCVDIQLPTPFLYDPSQGDLVVDVDYPTGSFSGGNVGQMDVQSTNSNSARIYASSNYPAANNTSQNHGVVIEVGYVPPAGYAQVQQYGTGCYDAASASFYENHTAFDLSNTSLQMTNVGTGYLTLPGTTPVAPSTSTPVVMGDDQVLPFALGWTLPYPGGTTTDLYVSSNGFVNLTANTNSGCCAFNLGSFLSNGPVFAAKWRDLNPSAGGSVYFDTDPVSGSATVTFDMVPDYGSTNQNTFQYYFDSAGTVELRFGTVAATAGGTGWSPGLSNRDPGSIDISAQSLILTAPDSVALSLATSARPVLGTNFTLDTSNVPTGSPLGATLLSLFEFNPGIPIPGMAGCEQYVGTEAVVLFVPAGPTASVPFAIPTNNALVGVQVKSQSAAIDSGVNAVGAVTSNAVRMIIDIN